MIQHGKGTETSTGDSWDGVAGSSRDKHEDQRDGVAGSSYDKHEN